MQSGFFTIVDLLLYTLSSIHYFAFFISFLIWVFLLILTFALRKKRVIFILLVLISTLLFFAAPVIGYLFVELEVKKSAIEDVEIKQLTFIDKAIVKATLKNSSKQTLKKCRILSIAVPKNGNLLKNRKKIRFAKTSFTYDLKPSGSEKFYITLENIKDVDGFDIKNYPFCK